MPSGFVIVQFLTREKDAMKGGKVRVHDVPHALCQRAEQYQRYLAVIRLRALCALMEERE